MHKRLLLSCLFLTAAALPAVAHHSFSMFDETKEVVLKGAVKEFQWSNPHTWIQLNVTDASGNVVEWSIEGGSPNLLGRQGWKRNTLKTGDQIEVTVHPLRDGQPGGSFMRAVLADGRTLGRNP
jgi:ABC-type oligopeptide transport system substrate-binding subunit